jgi:hypothetical protein
VLGLEGEVTVDVLAQPHSISFGEVQKGADASRELALQIAEPDRVKVTSVTVDDPRFEIIRKSGDAAGSASYDLRLKKPDKLGRVTAKVHVALTGADPSTLEVPITGEIVGDLRYPKMLSFRKTGDAFAPRDLTFTSRSNKPVHLLGVEDPAHVLTLDITQSKGDKAVVKVGVAKLTSVGGATVLGTLVVRTTDRDEPKIEIDYTVVYADSRDTRGPLPGRIRSTLAPPVVAPSPETPAP